MTSSELAIRPTSDLTVWLVILNWNGLSDTVDLCASLESVTYGGPAGSQRRPTLLVVDNGSTDGSVPELRNRFGHRVRILENGENLGYAAGNNAGVRLALSAGADVIGVLNNDTLAEPGFLEPLLRELVDHPKVAVSPDIRYADRPSESWFRGARIDERTGWPVHVPPREQCPSTAARIATPVLTGCCILADRGTWLEVGLFDPSLFLIFEDCDWSRRAVACGVGLVVVPASRLRHRVSSSFTGEAGLLGSYYFARNGLSFALRHLGVRSAVRFATHKVLRQAVASATSGSIGTSILSVVGLIHGLLGRSGPAGRWTRRFANRQLQPVEHGIKQ